MTERKTVTVSELNRYIKELVSGDDMLSALWVQGEVSNLKYHSSGHIYFSLKDSSSLVKCVMFRSRSAFLKFRLEDGMKVLVFGSVDVFERDGVYQIYADRIEPDGLGSLYAAFERLKASLAKEGLFDESHKRKLPFLPRCVGVVTSPTGAVIQDIRNVAGRRFAEIPILLYPSPVQGKDAAPIIAQTIARAGAEGKCDVLIVARGGGSLEDLWPFNEECVARAIYACPVPVVSAVGHETDFTIADFTADMRAPTPSAAAEIVIPEKTALKVALSELKLRLAAVPGGILRFKQMELARMKSSYVFKRPEEDVLRRRRHVEEKGLRLDMAASKASADKRNILMRYANAVKAFNAESVLVRKRAAVTALKENFYRSERYRTQMQRAKLNLLSEKLSALGPESVLARGYAIALTDGREAITSVKEARPGGSFTLVMKDGAAAAVFSEKQDANASFPFLKKECPQT